MIHRRTVDGPAGRRTWSQIALVVAGFAVLTIPATVVAGQLPGGGGSLRGLAVRAVAGLLVVVAVSAWAGRHLERGRLTGFGLRSPRRGWLTLVGVAMATTGAVAALVAAAVMTGSATFGGSSLAEAAVTALALLPLLLIASVLPEELVFRGYVQHALGRHVSPMPMIATQAGLFAVVTSLIGLSLSGALTAFLTGVGLGYLRLFSRGLWAVLGMRLSMATTGVILGQRGLEFTEATTFWELALGVGSFVVALVIGARLRPAASKAVGEGDQGTRVRRELTHKGILYDVGSSYMPGQHSWPRWRPEVVREELRVIDEDLHCTSVLLFGECPQRLSEAARMALDQGLHVWLQPRRFDAAVPQVLENLAEVAGIAERLRMQAPQRVGLVVGCEISLLHRGILPGGLRSRTRWLVVVSPDPERDLDMASFGIVRPPTLESGLSADDGHWEHKTGFRALARRYSTRIDPDDSRVRVG